MAQCYSGAMSDKQSRAFCGYGARSYKVCALLTGPGLVRRGAGIVLGCAKNPLEIADLQGSTYETYHRSWRAGRCGVYWPWNSDGMYNGGRKFRFWASLGTRFCECRNHNIAVNVGPAWRWCTIGAG